MLLSHEPFISAFVMARTWQETALLAVIVLAIFPLLNKWLRNVTARNKKIENWILYVLLGLVALFFLMDAIGKYRQ